MFPLWTCPLALTARQSAHRRWMGRWVNGHFRMNSLSAAALSFLPSPIRSRADRNWNGTCYPVLHCTTSGSSILAILRRHPFGRQHPRLFLCLTEICRREATGFGSVEVPATVPSGNGRQHEISRRDQQQVFSRCHLPSRPALRPLLAGRRLQEPFDTMSGSMIQRPEFRRLTHRFELSKAI